MLKGFKNILIKELKELTRDPKILIGIIIVPLVMFPALGAVLGYAQQSAIEQALGANILVLNNDGGTWSQTLIAYLEASQTKISVVNNTTPQQAVTQGLLTQYNSTQLIEIPPGFSQNMTLYTEGKATKTALNLYGEFSLGGLFSSIGSAGVSALVYNFNRAVAPDAIYTTQSSIIKGEIQTNIDPSTLTQALLSQSIILPITIMILLTYSMQIAATSVAMEKEGKTLETLLTMPVDRFAILMGKLSSSAIVAGAGALTYLIGYSYVLSSAFSGIPTTAGPPIDLVKLGLAPSPLGYALLGINLFVTLLSGLALAVIISAFAEDVRGATALVGYIYPLIYVPSLALIYLDINTLPLALKTIFFAIPFSQPVIASKAVITGDYLTATFGIIYVAAFTIIVMYAASRLFATEKILTAKLRFKRKRKQEPNE